MREVTRGEKGSLDLAYAERSAEVRGVVAAYMRAAPIVLASPSLPPKDSSERTSLALRSDGEWVWSTAGAAMFESGEIDLDGEFISHVVAGDGAPLELSKDQTIAALALVMQGDENNSL
jgi:hypothetical protein